MKKILGAIALTVLAAAAAVAGPYEGTTLNTATGTAYKNLSGFECIAASSSTPFVCKIFLDGPASKILLASIGAIGANGITISSPTTNLSSATFMAPVLMSGTSLYLSGPNGYIISGSSIIGGRFEGDGSALTGIVASAMPAQNVTAGTFVVGVGILPSGVDLSTVTARFILVGASTKTLNDLIDAEIARALAAEALLQPLDADLTDLADGSLTGSKVGTGIVAANIAAGTFALDVGIRPSGVDLSTVTTALGLKADASALTSGLALKVDKNDPAQVNLSTVTTALGLKADKGNTEHIDLSTVTAAIALKADAAATTSSLALKVDKNDPAQVNLSTVTTALAAKQDLDADLTDLADGSLTGSKVGTGVAAANIAAGTFALGVGILPSGVDLSTITTALAGKQDLDADLTDLADGTLTGSKVGTGIVAANIAAGTFALGVGILPSGVDLSTVTTALALKAPLASPTFTGTVTAADLSISGLISGAGSMRLDGAAGVRASSFTATYGLNASTAVITYVQASSITNTGNAFVYGSLGLRAGTVAPATKLHMSSGTITIDGNTAKSITALGSVSIGTNAISATGGAGSVLLQVGGSYPKILLSQAESTMTAVEFAAYTGNPWMRMAQGDAQYNAQGFLYAPSPFGVGMSVGSYYAAPNGYYLGRTSYNYPSWYATMSSGDSAGSGSSYGQADRYDISRASASASAVGAGQLTPQPFLSIVAAGLSGIPGNNTSAAVRIPGGIEANASYLGTAMFDVGASSFGVKWDGEVYVGQKFTVAGTTFTVDKGIVSAESQPFVIAQVGSYIQQNIQTDITFDAVSPNRGNMWGGSSSSSTFTVPTGGGGIYELKSQFYPNAAAGTWETYFLKNGTGVKYCVSAQPATQNSPQCSAKLVLAAGDVIKVAVYQSGLAPFTHNPGLAFAWFEMGKIW